MHTGIVGHGNIIWLYTLVLHYHTGNLAERIIAIVAGSGGRGFLVLLLLLALISAAVCLMHMWKWKGFNLTSNVDYNCKMNVKENNTELEAMYDTIDLVEGTNELQQSIENQDFKVIMEQTMAYKSSIKSTPIFIINVSEKIYIWINLQVQMSLFPLSYTPQVKRCILHA